MARLMESRVWQTAYDTVSWLANFQIILDTDEEPDMSASVADQYISPVDRCGEMGSGGGSPANQFPPGYTANWDETMDAGVATGRHNASHSGCTDDTRTRVCAGNYHDQAKCHGNLCLNAGITCCTRSGSVRPHCRERPAGQIDSDSRTSADLSAGSLGSVTDNRRNCVYPVTQSEILNRRNTFLPECFCVVCLPGCCTGSGCRLHGGIRAGDLAGLQHQACSVNASPTSPNRQPELLPPPPTVDRAAGLTTLTGGSGSVHCELQHACDRPLFWAGESEEQVKVQLSRICGSCSARCEQQAAERGQSTGGPTECNSQLPVCELVLAQAVCQGPHPSQVQTFMTDQSVATCILNQHIWHRPAKQECMHVLWPADNQRAVHAGDVNSMIQTRNLQSSHTNLRSLPGHNRGCAPPDLSRPPNSTCGTLRTRATISRDRLAGVSRCAQAHNHNNSGSMALSLGGHGRGPWRPNSASWQGDHHPAASNRFMYNVDRSMPVWEGRQSSHSARHPPPRGVPPVSRNMQAAPGPTRESPDPMDTMESEPGMQCLFKQLLSQFYFETYLWMYVNVLEHPRGASTRQHLKHLGDLCNQSLEQVTVSMLQGYLGAFQHGRSALLNEIQGLLNEMLNEGGGQMSQDQALWLRELAIELGIHLNPRQMLRSFSAVVRDILTQRLESQQQQGPQTRQQRRARERNPVQSESPDRRAFQPLDNQVRPAVIPQVQQPPPVVDIDQMAGPNPAVTMATYGLPVPSGSHYMPLCTGAHVPLCTTGPTRSIPGCAMPVPTCATMQHVPMCSLQQIPMTQALHPYLQAHHQGAPHYQSHPMMHQPHLPAQSQFMAAQSHMQAHDDDVQMLGDHHHHRPPPYHHHHHHHHIPASMPRGPPLNPSPPGVYLQEPTVHPNPHDMYNPFGRLRRGSTSRGRWRSSIPPPPPPYPGFLLHFLAMLGSPTVPPYGMNPNNEASEVENYEALLNLAERLGEAKPRGLQKVEIDQLPKYYYNAEGRRSTMDQTSCVVCMCDFENHQKLRVLPCSHEFHAKCVDKWLKANRTCPICRADSSEGVSQSE